MRDWSAGGHRHGVVLCGERGWAVDTAMDLLAQIDFMRVLWVSDCAPVSQWSLTARQVHTVLGSETDAVIFDAYAGLDPDALGAVAGTIRAGGVLILLTPMLRDWPQFDDPDYARLTVAGCARDQIQGRFLRRLARLLMADAAVMVVGQNGQYAKTDIPNATDVAIEQTPPVAEDKFCRTIDQSRAVDALLRVATGRPRRPVVLTADRGRGKSAAMGIAAARMLEQGMSEIVVTAPRLDAVEQIFAHAARLLPQAQVSRAALHMGGGSLRFVLPDQLLDERRSGQMLMIDEAAGIPTALLARLLDRYTRIAFATTVHGYEGTGRGFSLRFQKILDARVPQWRAMHLDTPIRWAADDPLERLIFRALMLDANAAEDEAIHGAAPADLHFEILDRDALLDDEQCLSQLFGLLVLAHYRTRPFDLRLLLDAPNVTVAVLRRRGAIAATALLTTEGAMDADTCRSIWAGDRRPRGHLFPESLAAQMGLEQAPLLRCARVVRIAVHPLVQGRGLGTHLLEKLVGHACAQGFDYVGSSFGATPALLDFWSRSQFVPIRTSATRGAASGEHSVLVMRALSSGGEALAASARERFEAQLPQQLGEPLSALDREIVARLLVAPNVRPVTLEAADWRDLVAFAHGGRPYESCIGSLWRLGCAALVNQSAVSQQQRDAMIVKVMQRQPWRLAAEVLGESGRAGVLRQLRAAVAALTMQYGSADALALARELSRR